jgi:hypothetical protein
VSPSFRRLANFTLAALCTLVVLMMPGPSAMAGPPLICHPLDAGDSPSLPWKKDGSAPDSSYSTASLEADVLAILTPKAPVLARMENLRRAALYLDRDRRSGDQLLGLLMARAMDADAAGTPDAMAWFDAGYFYATAQQLGVKASFGPMTTKGQGASSVPGYLWIRRAITLKGDSIELNLAAALVTADRRIPEHAEHLRKALAADFSQQPASITSLTLWLAQINGVDSIEALRGKLGVADAGRGR